MEFRNSLLAVILLLLVVSCVGDNNQIQDQQEEAALVIRKSDFLDYLGKQSKEANDYDKIIVIPAVGCTGCISAAESFYLANHYNKRLLFIFTIISDVKMFKQDFPSVEEGDNVIFDDKDELYYMGFYSQFPYEFNVTEDDNIELVQLVTDIEQP